MSPLAVVSWGLIEGAGNELASTAVSWGLLGVAPDGEPPSLVKRVWTAFQALILGIL